MRTFRCIGSYEYISNFTLSKAYRLLEGEYNNIISFICVIYIHVHVHAAVIYVFLLLLFIIIIIIIILIISKC